MRSPEQVAAGEDDERRDRGQDDGDAGPGAPAGGLDQRRSDARPDRVARASQVKASVAVPATKVVWITWLRTAICGARVTPAIAAKTNISGIEAAAGRHRGGKGTAGSAGRGRATLAAG
ncbi:MAG TPA: hypothetical protein VHA80_06300 [Solirubrobacterales bacterium]|nr:hypothetical protein [Solirubrobacterales bacterium]